MGYLFQAQRDGCGNCAHARHVQPTGAMNDLHALRCTRADFGTTALAICNHHQRKDAHVQSSPHP